MLKIIAATIKELTLLRRDKTGLLILFIMPALLVIVITLVQENVMELTGQKKIRLLFLDLDGGELGSSLRQQLAEGNIEIISWEGTKKKSIDLQDAVTAGDYQVGIVIEEDSSAKFRKNTTLLFQKSTEGKQKVKVAAVPVSVYFDPGVMPGYRKGVTAQIRVALESVALSVKVEVLGKELDNLLGSLGIPKEYAPLPAEELGERIGQPILAILDKRAGEGSLQATPYNPVQQNVPAWAIFGMFFTAITIAGTILQERNSGIWVRLNSLPVSHLKLFTGKVLAYIGVCLCQFFLIGLIGFYFFPYIGLPAFTVLQNLTGVLFIIIFTSLAACGFGIFLGVICNSYEQASALGSSFVVTAAALGGIMVPVYAMPEVMQQISIISPLNWALTAFHDLLTRGFPFSAILDDLGRLALFSLASVIFAWKLSQSRI